MPKPKPPELPSRAAWGELEKSTEAIQTAIAAILEINAHSLEGKALLERLATVTALQRKLIAAFKRHYLPA